MTSLNDEQLIQYGERSKGKVVLVTGTFRDAEMFASLTNYKFHVTLKVLHLGLGKRPRWCSPISSKLSKRSSNVHRVHHEGNRAKLVLGDLNVAGIDEVVREIKKFGGCVFIVQKVRLICAP